MLVNQDAEGNGSVHIESQENKASVVSGDLVVTPHPDVQFSVLDGEAVLLNLETGSYFTLNRVGTVAWENFDGERTLTQVHSNLCERFEVRQEVAQEDLLSLVSNLDHEGLIQSERR